MSISDQVRRLLDNNTTLETQIDIINELNQHIYYAESLYDIVKVFLSEARLVRNPFNNALDIVGTGGDGKNTLNYSTLCAYAVSSTGVPIIKHGNKSATSQCGSFDLLERMGESIPTTPEQAEAQLRQSKRVFLFAPYFHPIFKNVQQARKHFAASGQKTIFNILGPLLNPARPKRMLVGVYEEALIKPFSEVLAAIGVEYGCVVYGSGFDEFSVCGTNTYCQINNGQLTYKDFNPTDYGYGIAEVSELCAGDAASNYQEAKDIFSGNLLGPKRDMLEINILFALAIADGFKQELQYYQQQAQKAINPESLPLFAKSY